MQTQPSPKHPCPQTRTSNHLPLYHILALKYHSLGAKSTAVPTIDSRVKHTSTALGAIVPETVNRATRESS
jgi:hypothetical protein